MTRPVADRHPSAPAATTVPRRYWVILCAILILAAGLRVHRLGVESLWIDELYTVAFSAGNCRETFTLPHDRVIETPPRLTSLDAAVPAWNIPTTLRDDRHPPLYYILVRLWRDAFGSSEVALRSLSVAASLAAIVPLFDLGRLLFSPGAALWACAIMAVAQAEIRYAQEARSYMLLTAAVLVSADVLVRIEQFGFSTRRGVALAASMFAVVLTHYYGAAGCVGMGFYALVRFRGKVRTHTLGMMAIAAVIYIAAWGPFFVQQLHGYSVRNNWLGVETNGQGWPPLACLLRLLRAPIRFFAEPSFRNPGMLPMVVAAVLVLPLLRVRRVPALLLPAVWAVAWFGLIAGLDMARSTHQMDFTRYLLGAAPAVYLAAAGLLWDRRGWIRHAVPGLFVLYCVTSLPWTYDAPKAEWRRLGHDVARHVKPDDLLLYSVSSGNDFFSGVMYLAVDYYAPHVRTPSAIITRPLSADSLARARAAHTLWLISDAATPDVARLVPGYRVASSSFSWGVGFLFRLAPDTPPPATGPANPADGTGTNSTPTSPGT